MSWDTKDIFARRHEFVTLAGAGGLAFAALCRRFGISRKTGYKWCARFRQGGTAALLDQPHGRGRRRNQTTKSVERVVVTLRRRYPTWGPRKLQRKLELLGHEALPAVSTFARILRRHGCVAPADSRARQSCQRFSRAQPNELWQMDFKGHFALQRGGRCHPLTVLDDCSRYLVGLHACADEQTLTVQQRLERIFTIYGLPESILCDNGPPWGGGGPEHSQLSVWLLRLGVRVLHGRPHHPQTQGKDERFHRTLKADLLARHDWRDIAQAQRRFVAYRRLYNNERPHEAIDLQVPASRYRPSSRSLPSRLPIAQYESGVPVRPVKAKGEITFRDRFFYIGQAFTGLQVALRATATDGIFRVCYAAFTLGVIDLTRPPDRPRGNYHPLLPADQNCNP
ncbi:MAG TPA: IS481 family transposase [Opitutaceae bacterium]|nr:IS481 family transposase [Opitutaceae bacterium]